MKGPRCLVLARTRPSLLSARTSSVQTRRALVTLAIESSCDDTAVAVLSRRDDDGAGANGQRYALRFNESVASDHRAFRGIEPNVAVQGHASTIAPLLRRAIAALPDADAETTSPSTHAPTPKICWAEDGTPKRVPDFISVTRGPGLMSNLTVGITAAKGLAVAWDVPLLGVHHMQAHALTPRLVSALGMPMAADVAVRSLPGTPREAGRRKRRPDEDFGTQAEEEYQAPRSTLSAYPEFPFLSLLVSGGHTQLVHSRSLTDHRIIATTLDTAIGNALDQAARAILPTDVLDASPDVMYGRHLETFAFAGADPEAGPDYSFFRPSASRRDEMTPAQTGYAWSFTSPLHQSRRLAFSFSGIYTQACRHAASVADDAARLDERRALARHTMASIFGHLAERLCLALDQRPELRAARALVVAGGVASNRFLMHVLAETLAARRYDHLRVLAPPPSLCTDNAAMIAWAGMEMFDAGFRSDLSILPIRKWPMDPDHGPGILGVQGWIKAR
jgi:N6-L-threonylcarbamoyladenine synthase